MKKFFLGALAIAGLVACVQTEEVGVSNPADGQIAFGGYVGNQSRAAVDNSTDISELNHFTVWGYMDMSVGQIFNNELVTKDVATNAWTYEGTQYWAAGHDYRFFAITPYGDPKVPSHVTITPSADPIVDGLGTITFTNEEGKEDVLYASKTESTVTAIPEKVTFQFNHLLSKVKFTFTNGYDGEFATIAVKNVTMEVPYKGTVKLDESVKTQYTWENLEGTKTLEFGPVEGGAQLVCGDVKEADEELLTIPAGVDQTYKVTFDVIVYQGEPDANGDQVSTTHHFESIIADKALVAGTSYNFTATIDADALNAKAIVFDAKVDEWEKDGDTPLDPIAGTVVRVATIDELQTALNTTVANYPYHILITNDLEGVVVAPEVADQKVTIDGQGHTFKGAIQINGKTAYAGATTVIKNINFVSGELVNGDSFIWCGEALGTNLRYPDNIIVENCTFTATGAAEKAAVAVKVWALDHGQLVIKGGKADGVHSLMQVTSSKGANVLVDGVEIVNAKNGISLDNAGKTVIKNSTISTAEYGIRANSDRNGANTTIEATTITAKQPIVVRKVTLAGYALTLGTGVVLNTEELHQVIFTAKSDDAEYVAPAVEFAYSSVENFIVFPEVSVNTVKVATADELVAALKAGKDVYFLNDITVAATDGGYKKAGILQNKAQTIDGAGHTLTVTGAGGSWDCGIYTNGGLIKNLTVAGSFRGIFTAGQSADLHIEKVEFKNVVYTFNSDGKMPVNPFGVYVSNSKVNGWTSHSDMHTEVVYTNCSFGEGSGYKFCRPYGKTAFVGCTFCAGYTLDKSQTTEITLTDCTWE